MIGVAFLAPPLFLNYYTLMALIELDIFGEIINFFVCLAVYSHVQFVVFLFVFPFQVPQQGLICIYSIIKFN